MFVGLRWVVIVCLLSSIGVWASATGQVLFDSIEDISFARSAANIGLSECADQSNAIDSSATSVSTGTACSVGSDDFIVSSSSTIAGSFSGDPLDVQGANLSVASIATAAASPEGFLGSKSSTASSAVQMNFRAISRVRYRVTLDVNVESVAFTQNGGDEASTGLSDEGFSVFEDISASENGGADGQQVVREGILPVGMFTLRVSASANALANFAEDGATSMASLSVTFEPLLTGGCCIDSSCSQLTREDCTNAGGTYAGDKVDCVDCAPEAMNCDLIWAGPATGDFAQENNWDPRQVPTDSEDGCNNLRVDQPGTVVITLGTGRLANSLRISDGESTLSNGTLTLSGRDGKTALLVEKSGSLEVLDGRLNVAATVIGDVSGSNSSLLLSEGGRLESGGEVVVGGDGSSKGSLSVSAMERPSFLSATILSIGSEGEGDLFAGGLATLQLSGSLFFGVLPGSRGTGVFTGKLGAETPTLIDVGGTVFVGSFGVGDVVANGPFRLDTADLEVGSAPDSEGTFVIADATSTVVVGNSVTLGGGGNGRLELRNGADLTTIDTTLGLEGGSEGTLLITEANTVYSQLGDLKVGVAGAGTLNVSKGAALDFGERGIVGALPDSEGTISLSGNETQTRFRARKDLHIGEAGSGEFNAHGNVSALVDGNMVFGNLAGSEGHALLGVGDVEEERAIVVVSDRLTIAEAGDADITVLGPASLFSDRVSSAVGTGTTAQVDLVGSASLLDVLNQLDVAGAGNATFSIGDGAALTAGGCTIGAGSGGLGIVRLSGGSSRFEVALDLRVGGNTNGLLELTEGGGVVSCENVTVGGTNLAAGGTVNLFEGGNFRARRTMVVGADVGPALVRVEGGATLTVGDSIDVSTEGLFIARGDAVIDTPEVVGTGRIQIASSATLISKQTDTPGGPVRFTGALRMEPDGSLEVEAGRRTALRIEGSATLGGTLLVVLTPERSYVTDEQVDLIDFAGETEGQFTSVSFPNASDEFAGTVSMENGILRLSVTNAGNGLPSGEGEGEGEGEAPGGCPMTKAALGKRLDELLGDMLLLGLALGTLIGLTVVTSKH